MGLEGKGWGCTSVNCEGAQRGRVGGWRGGQGAGAPGTKSYGGRPPKTGRLAGGCGVGMWDRVTRSGSQRKEGEEPVHMVLCRVDE